MPRVADLSAEEAADIASGALSRTSGRTAGLKLLYYALTRDKSCSKALSVLIKALGFVATNDIVAVVSEYAYNAASEEKHKSRIGFMRRIALDGLGMLTSPSTDLSEMSTNEWALFWEHSPDFVVHETEYAQLRNDVLRSYTLLQAFEAAVILVGVRSQLVQSTLEGPVEFHDCFHAENFQQIQDYASFLAAEELPTEDEN